MSNAEFKMYTALSEITRTHSKLIANTARTHRRTDLAGRCIFHLPSLQDYGIRGIGKLENVFVKWKIFIATVMVEMSFGDDPRYLSLSQIEKMSLQSRI